MDALVLADTTLFSGLKEPRANLDEGELVHLSLARDVLARVDLAAEPCLCSCMELLCRSGDNA